MCVQVWSCSSCFSLFHLPCIQKWARDSAFLVSSVTDEDFGQKKHPWPWWGRRTSLSNDSENKTSHLRKHVNCLWRKIISNLSWCFLHSPKCRAEYPPSATPNRYVWLLNASSLQDMCTSALTLCNGVVFRYMCYCGKLQDPPADPWLVPHSCGSICQKELKPACGHTCLLLCHPGNHTQRHKHTQSSTVLAVQQTSASQLCELWPGWRPRSIMDLTVSSGPCPPCPKMVPVSCMCCKSKPLPRRCSNKVVIKSEQMKC